MPATVPALVAADSARLRTRAARHARSLPLAAAGVATLVITGLSLLAGDWLWLMVLVPLAAFLLTFLTAFVLRLPTGVGVGSDGYGIAIVLSAVIAFLLPSISFWIGVPSILGMGLAVLGLRASDRFLWLAGIATMAVSFVLTATGDALFDPSAPTAVGGLALGLALLVVAGLALRGERQTLASGGDALSIGDPATDNLRVLAVLGDADEADQPALARLTGVEERNLAARLHDLTEAGLVHARITKNRNWAQITREGREELRTRREALRGVAEHRKA